MDKRELLQTLKALHSLSSANKAFLQSTLSKSAPLTHYKNEIAKAVNPSVNSPIDLRRGRKAIRQFAKAAPDDLFAKVDLMVFYVEQAAAQTLQFGTISESFYDSMHSMLNSILDLSDQLDPLQQPTIIERIRQLDDKTSGRIGWGVCDRITEVFEELNERNHVDKHNERE